ncbi:MAG: CDP-diacylglycerol--serine O-phosphatidyltransferase [Alphaproteobacteria bacterium]
MARTPNERLSREERRQLRRDRLNRLLPNALTMLGLCCGLTAVRFGLQDKWEVSILLIAAAALLDTLDGRMARLMGGQTELGGQLDSLVDAISFGVAPVMLIYLWSLNNAGGIGWAIAILFVVCSVLRLARFNVASAETDLPTWAGNYFSGVPAPAAAGMVLLPLMLGVETNWDFLRSAWLTLPWTIVISGLMIAPIPTYSFKRIRVPKNLVTVSLAGVALFAAALITEPWLALSALILAFSASIPLAVLSFRKMQREEELNPSTNATEDNDAS